MTLIPGRPPPAIERGLRGLCKVADCIVEGEPFFSDHAKHWVVVFTIQREAKAPFVATTTRWYALIDGAYPFGRVAIYPADEGGLEATFPHQNRNTRSEPIQQWRDGKLCLDSPFSGERRLNTVRDPIGDAEGRLQWHVRRAQLWLERAATSRLLAPGDPFELPARPAHMTVRKWIGHRVVHDENATSFNAWRGREGSFGTVILGALPGITNAIKAARFVGKGHSTVREWLGGDNTKSDDSKGFWWLLREPLVLPPWEAPATWGQLRRAAKAQGLDPDNVLRWLLPSIRGASCSNFLMMGYPIPSQVGTPASEVHWQTLVLPKVPQEVGQPRGFRPNARGWWFRDRTESFTDHLALQYLCTENWSPERLQARGRLPLHLRNLRVAILGLGALGSALAEMLVRSGVTQVALLDKETLTAGNICRHTATLNHIGMPKVSFVAQRLRQISPGVQVTELASELPTSELVLADMFDDCDALIDCTASDEVLMLLEKAWWSIPRTFASFSLGYGGKRLFSFGVSGHHFPFGAFAECFRPWLEREAVIWGQCEEVFEGAGCWSPLFPARYDDVVLAAATCLKEFETLVAKRGATPRYRVFSQQTSDEGFQGFRSEPIPAPEEVQGQ